MSWRSRLVAWSQHGAPDWLFTRREPRRTVTVMEPGRRPRSLRRQAKQALIIGARGVLGTLTARAFQDAGWEVRCAARRPRAGEVHVDLDQPATIAPALSEHELVVNTVPHH